MIDSILVWFVVFYAFGTAFGLWFGYNRGITVATEGVVDNLIDGGYLKTRGPSSNLEILKHDEE